MWWTELTSVILVWSFPLPQTGHCLYNIIYLLPLLMEKKNAFLVVITQCCIVDLSSHYSKWTNYYNLQEWNRWGNGRVSGIPRHKCQPDMGEQFWQKASFLASNGCWCSCFLMQGWRSASLPSGVSEVEVLGSINGELQTLDLSLPLQFNWDMLQLFLALSLKISSVCLCAALSWIC